jgi:hypothetical protein
LETRLRELFPSHDQQDAFMRVGTIAAFGMALIGFVLGFFTPALGGNWLSGTFLLGAIALLLFLILRESTLTQIRARGGISTRPEPGATQRQPPGRPSPAGARLPDEAATAESSPPTGDRPTPK